MHGPGSQLSQEAWSAIRRHQALIRMALGRFELAGLLTCRVPEDSVHFAEKVEGVIVPTVSSPVSVLGV